MWNPSLNSLPRRAGDVNLANPSLFLRGLCRCLGKFFFVSHGTMRHESNIVLWKFRFTLWVQLSRRFAGISCLQIVVTGLRVSVILHRIKNRITHRVLPVVESIGTYALIVFSPRSFAAARRWFPSLSLPSPSSTIAGKGVVSLAYCLTK